MFDIYRFVLVLPLPGLRVCHGVALITLVFKKMPAFQKLQSKSAGKAPHLQYTIIPQKAKITYVTYTTYNKPQRTTNDHKHKVVCVVVQLRLRPQ